MSDNAKCLLAGLLTVWMCHGCGNDPAPAPAGEQKDYKEMLARAELRKSEKTLSMDVQNAVHEFQTRYGRLPTNLLEVTRFGIMDSLPELPAGQTYAYNPELGNVSLRTVDATRIPDAPEPLPFEN